MKHTISVCKKAAELSTEFESNNSELKRKYLIRNIMLYNYIVSQIKESYGSFGTGYPFYALSLNLTGKLPIIEEQLRYNDELVRNVDKSNLDEWPCYNCLSKNNNSMPDLKQICIPCSSVNNELKPRKIINRLPDLDLWMICKDDAIDVVKEKLSLLLNQHNLYPSDIDPLKTILDLSEITDNLKNGHLPRKNIPIDAHIIEYSTMYSLIEQVPFVIEKSKKENTIPYLPIHPLSYRKTWQYDDMPYNFIHDYLSSLTEYNFEPSLKEALIETRKFLANHYSPDELYNYLINTGPDSVKRRHKTLELKNRFKERIDIWKK